jgi:hypothetical protein
MELHLELLAHTQVGLGIDLDQMRRQRFRVFVELLPGRLLECWRHSGIVWPDVELRQKLFCCEDMAAF